VHEKIREIFENEYDLGIITELNQFTIGAHNKSFGITALKNGEYRKWFFRVYASDKKQDDILYEHQLLQFVNQNDSSIIAVPVPTNSGSLFLQNRFDNEFRFSAVFKFLEGDDCCYSWIYNDVPDILLTSSATLVARYHKAVFGFSPKIECSRSVKEEDIILFASEWYETIETWLDAMKSDSRTKLFTDYMLSQMKFLQVALNKAKEISWFSDILPRMHIHSEIQISNLTYKNNEACGLFDFDWAHWGERLYDVAYAAKAFCCPWDHTRIGEVDLRKLNLFIGSYNLASLKIKSPLGCLNKQEVEAFPFMLLLGFLRCTYDFVDEFFHDRTLNVFQYYLYALRFTRNARFVMDNFDVISRIAAMNNDQL